MIAAIAIAALPGCLNAGNNADKKETLTIFHAGSLSVPFREISEAFEKKHPNVTVRAEAAGTRDAARKISDLGRPCDVFGAADYQVVEELLMPEHADYNILFATNDLSIVYTKRSRLHERINADNWSEILLDEKVTFGRSDPNRDPCGYRTMMLFQLAEKHYRLPGLAEKLSTKDAEKYIRPKETDLLALLESGEIDYLFIYRSVGVQHGLEVLMLPDEISLGSPKCSDYYKQAVVKVTGKKPGELVEFRGEPIVYSVTIPKNAENHEMAQAWVSFLLSPDGRKIMEKNGQSVITPAIVDHLDRLPAGLEKYCKQE